MTTEQLKAESNYKVSMSMAKAMLGQGLLTRAEYAKIDTIMLKKYKPILSALR